jgi:nuclear pore complex protein Nup188
MNSSWEAVSTTLYDAKTIQRPHRALEEFLADPYVLQSLARPYDIFSFGNGNQAKSAFETKTAAINVTPTAKKEYSIAEVKEDALWLSKTAGIDEISALRIIVLEYQSRARTQLQSEFSDEERVSLQEVGGNLSTDISVALPLATVITSFASTEAGSPRATNATKERALKLFLSERRSLIKCAGLCLEAALDVSKGGAEVSNKGKNKGKSRVEDLPWLQRVGQALLETFDKEQKNMQAYLSDSIRTLKSGFEKMEKGSGWFEVEDVREEFETQWLNSQIVEATYTLEIIFRIVDSQDMLSSADIVTEWYKFVGAYGFFDQFETVSKHRSTLNRRTELMMFLAVSVQSGAYTSPTVVDFRDFVGPAKSAKDVGRR